MKVSETKLTRKTQKQVKTLKSIIRNHEDFKKSYFYSSPSHASARRAKEFDNEFKFNTNQGVITVEQKLSCSAKNMYYSLDIKTGDCKKRTIKMIEAMIEN